MGLLENLTSEQGINGLLGNPLLNIGLGILANNTGHYGQFSPAVGLGGQQGMQAMQVQQQLMQRKKLMELEAQKQQMEMDAYKKKLADEEQFKTDISNAYRPPTTSSNMPFMQAQTAALQSDTPDQAPAGYDINGQTNPGGLDYSKLIPSLMKYDAPSAIRLIGEQQKENAPQKLGKDENLVSGKPDATGKYQTLWSGSSSPEIGNISPDKFTPESLAKFSFTKNYGDLVPTEKPENQPPSVKEWQIAKEQGYKGTLLQFIIDQKIAGRTPAQPPAPTVYTDNAGNAWNVRPGSGAVPLIDAKTGQQIQGAPKSSPAAEQLYKDYASNPQVKEANDLEPKLKPVADYMVNFAKTGKSINANDAALAKLYLATTTSMGSRAYAVDNKALASLPDLGDRLGNMASSFFAGKDLTDQTRHDMFTYITQHYQSLDSARKQIKDQTIARGKAKLVTPAQIFGDE